jgi:plasmid stabilization system protein ParE
MDSLRFHPAARAELIEALVYLEEHRPGYGDKFAAEVEELIERIVQLPESGAPLSGYPPELDVRAFRSKTFRYALIVATLDGERMVHAIAHQHRSPGYWASRIR